MVLAYPAQSQFAAVRTAFETALTPLAEGRQLEIRVSSQITSHAAQRGVPLLPGVKNIIAVASGKGGVGKSTTAVNLALALAAEGARVGLLDADIYGPSQPLMLGLQGQRPETPDGKHLKPVENYGIQTMSIGYLVDNDQAMVWRGPMVSQALQQLLNDTQWDNLDYLVIDMPPGTGDVQLTLAQKVPVTGAVIVTTPQDIALLDARKGVTMFQKVGVPILGLVENMAIHICSNCGHAEHIFGEGGATKMAADYGVEVLGFATAGYRHPSGRGCLQSRAWWPNRKAKWPISTRRLPAAWPFVSAKKRRTFPANSPRSSFRTTRTRT
ncbi:iron-sulfur cluster carrier protein ApbC [Paludibacterium denitrificans]|uniref:iron-sulfur cluster carrier protein ApbC n=1 Tax=Paludibacterium denitrificans TaxID=2675226 RepID=UPI0028ACAA4E|nr:iron-sulfur cluster carrier protein ApbC [Paludibacterium denitrificans]